MKRRNYFLIALIVIVLGAIVLSLPPVNERLVYHINLWKTQLFYALNPPQDAVFVPKGQVATAVQKTLDTFTSTPVTESTVKPAANTATPGPTEPPTAIPTPLPPAVALKGVRYIDQHGALNYCAPANLAMELSYWGWGGTREDTGKYLKPFPEDFNVMPYEMVNYIHDQTKLQVVLRNGGTLNLLKSLISAGYPVLIEKGVTFRDLSGTVSWMGHYNVLTGYDDAAQEMIVQDSYIQPNYKVKYDQLIQEWRSFNYVFLVVYTPDKEADLMKLLGDYAGEDKSNQIAAQTASNESVSLTGDDQFYAYFNRGTSLTDLQDYNGAASAYDQAFQAYASLPKDNNLPYRIMWYETGPYFAYYYTGRYQDVINLATTTLDAVKEPYLEESYYWRAKAEDAVGDQTKGIADLCLAIKYHAGFTPAMDELTNIGATCP
jgi:Peptidase_C39 like family